MKKQWVDQTEEDIQEMVGRYTEFRRAIMEHNRDASPSILVPSLTEWMMWQETMLLNEELMELNVHVEPIGENVEPMCTFLEEIRDKLGRLTE